MTDFEAKILRARRNSLPIARAVNDEITRRHADERDAAPDAPLPGQGFATDAAVTKPRE